MLDDKVKILIYVGAFELPDKNASAHRVLNNGKALCDIGYKVVYIDVNKNVNNDIVKTKKDYYGFECYSMGHNSKRFYSIDDIKKIYNLYTKKVVGIVAFDYHSIALLKLISFCKEKNIKLFADCTEWHEVPEKINVHNVIKFIDFYLTKDIIQKRLNGIIVISKFMKDFYKDSVATICVPPLIDIKDDKWINTSPNAYFGKSLNIIYAGSPGLGKDKLNILIEALASLLEYDFKFCIVGIDRNQFLKNYSYCDKYLNLLSDRVEFKGRIEHKKVIEMVKKADFSMFYRNIDNISMAGFPTKFVEALSCGTPVITNNSSDLDEYLKNGVNGYWINSDVKESLESIFKQDITSLRKMKKNVNNRQFDYRNYISEFTKMF